MERVGDDIFVHVVGEVVVEALADVLVDRLQLDEDQRQAVDETDQIGAAVVVRRADTCELQLAYGKEAIGTRRVVEVDHPGTSGLLAALGIPVLDGNAASNQPVKIPVVLHHRAADVVGRQFPHRVLDGGIRQVGIEPSQRGSQVPGEHRLAFGVGTAEGTVQAQKSLGSRRRYSPNRAPVRR